MNSDARQSRRRSRQDGAAGAGAPRPRSGKRHSLESSRGPVSHPRSRARNAPRGARCRVQESRHCHNWICSNRTSDFPESSSTCCLFTSTAQALFELSKPRSLRSAQRLHRWSRNVVLIDRSSREPGCRRLLAQLFRLAVTVAVGMNELWRTPRDTQAKEPPFPVLCVSPHCVQAATMGLLSETASPTRLSQRGRRHFGVCVQQA